MTTNPFPIPKDVQKQMLGVSWHEGCPVPIDHLSYIQPDFVNKEGKRFKGAMIVHKSVAKECLEIFKELEKYQPIEGMELISNQKYSGSDDLSMDANNSSAFNSRLITGESKRWSKHSYGLAVDINPFYNPYERGPLILPPKGKPFLTIRKDIAKLKSPVPDFTWKKDDDYPEWYHPYLLSDRCVQAFTNRGWTWGGDFTHCLDFHHFEKFPYNYDQAIDPIARTMKMDSLKLVPYTGSLESMGEVSKSFSVTSKTISFASSEWPVFILTEAEIVKGFLYWDSNTGSLYFSLQSDSLVHVLKRFIIEFIPFLRFYHDSKSSSCIIETSTDILKSLALSPVTTQGSLCTYRY